MELKDVFQGVLVKALSLTEAEVSSLTNEDGNLKDDALDVILSKHAEQVQKTREKAKADREEQYKRGLREKGTEYEKLLKEAGVDVGDAKGEEAVQKLKDHIESLAKPSDLDDDKVKNSPLFRSREKELLAQLKAKDEEHTKAWSERDAKEQRERTLSHVKAQAKSILDEMKPVLSEDPKKAANQLKLLELEIENHQYELDGDDVLIKDAKGERVENANGVPMSLSDFVKTTAEQYYDFQVSDKKGTAGDPTRGTLKKDAVKLQKPTTRAGYAEQLAKIEADPTLTHEQRAAMSAELMEIGKDLV
ncbi:MAG: hypothetical protein KDB84_09040 [Flavobacteriales bacterium]|nr:hypothetical protein [Flavobacteriales bacterium]